MDYRKLAADELRRIGELRTAEQVCRDRLTELNSELYSFKMPVPSTEPVQGSGNNQTEERWLNIISAKEDEGRRLKGIIKNIRRFDMAWAGLGERDKKVLHEWYIIGGSNCAERIATQENCDIRTAFRWRDEAMIRFSRVFYGAVVE